MAAFADSSGPFGDTRERLEKFKTGKSGFRQTGCGPKQAETRPRGSGEMGEKGKIRPPTVRECAKTAPEVRDVQGVGLR